MNRWRAKLLLVVLMITSFSSIVYEVVWTRYLSHVFGTSAFAITTVLTVFMAGLALGALFGGRIIDRVHKKYQFLALIQILIGISCILTLYLLQAVKYPYAWLYGILGGNFVLFNLALFILSAIILIIPTFLVGVAFPTVVKLYFHERKHMGESVGHTYMVDTIGGGLGAIITGFVLIAAIGFFRTSLIASGLNIICGIILFMIFWKTEFHSTKPDKEREIIRDPVILVLFFLSGFAALTFEVIWARHIALIYGSSIYSFSIVLCAFLTGLGIGSYFASRYIDRIKDKIVVFAFIELLIGLFGMALIVVFPWLEHVFLYLFFHVQSYMLFQIMLFIVCFAAILIPTLLMGATLPVLSAAYASEKKVGADVGRLYAVNSFGSIFGSFFAGFIIIPAAGLADASLFAGVIYIIVAFTVLYCFTSTLSKDLLRKVFTASVILLIAGFVFLFAFNEPDYTYKGVYYHGTRQADETVIFESSIETMSETVFKENSPYGTVTVFRAWDGSGVWLKNNGKTDASLADMMTQGLLAHLPIALHENPEDVLDIGMGGAFTLTSALSYESISNVDIVEIDPMVVEACRTVLAPYNDHVLEDPRANVIVADGRNYLFSTEKTYDVIISEPPNIWVSGVSNLFTQEFYGVVRDHLNDGGLFAQWYPRYEMNDYDYKIAIATLRSVFPYLYEFDLGGDVIIVASLHELDVHEDIDRERIGDSRVDDDINFMIYHGGDDTFYYDDYEDYDPSERNYNLFVSYYTGDPEAMDEFVKDVDIINSDDWPVLEFSTLRNKYYKFRT